MTASFEAFALEYAHFAAFSPDGQWILFNEAYMGSGQSVLVRRSGLRDLQRKLERDEEPGEEVLRRFEEGEPVHSSTFHDDCFLLGTRGGSVIATDTHGRVRWRHYFGGTVLGLDVSPSGKRLVVATAGGGLHLLDMNQPQASPFELGTSTHHER